MPPTTPPLGNPFGPGPGAAAAPAAPATAQGVPTTPQQAAVPQVSMDPVNQQAILTQLGRTGWTAAQPQPDIDYVNNGTGGVIPVVKGYNMVITGPTGTTQTVNLTYSKEGGKSPWGLADVEAAKALPKAATGTAIGTADTGYYLPTGPGGAYQMVVPPKTPNADEEMKKALDRIDRQQEMTEKQANEAAGRGYQTNADYQKMASQYANDQLGQAKLAEDIRQFNASQAQKSKEFDRQQDAKDKVDAANILKSGAETGLIGAQAQQVAQNVDIAGQKLPGELAQQGATLAATQASTANQLQATQIAGAPQLQGGLTSPVITQVDPKTGQVTQSQINLAYQPKTQAEIAARVGQISSLMQQKGAEVQAKVDRGEITADQALQEYNRWHDQNVTPQQTALQAAQEEAQFARGKDENAMRVAAYNEANTAAQRQIEAFKAVQGANAGMAMARPGYAEAVKQLSQGKIPSDMSVFAAQNVPTNPSDLVTKGTMDALKYIDPRAAAASGVSAPSYQAMDIGGLLNRTNYQPGAATPPPTTAGPPAAAPAAPPVPGPGQNPEWLAAWRTRQDLDQAQQARGAQAMAAYNAANQPAPGPEPIAAAAAAMPAPVAPRPVTPAPRPPMPTPEAPGMGYDPTNIQPVNPPGMGYDPTALWGSNRGLPLPVPPAIANDPWLYAPGYSLWPQQ